MEKSFPQLLCWNFFSLHGTGAHIKDGCGDVWCAKVWENKVIGALSGAGLEVSSFHLKGSTDRAE